MFSCCSSVLRRTGTLALRAILLLIMFELILRGHFWTTGQQNLYRSDDRFGWQPLPNVERIFQGHQGAYVIRTNSAGFRDRERSVRKDQDTVRVIVLGSSTVFGFGVDQTERFTATLDEGLPNVEVLNMGIPCTVSDQHFLVLRDIALKYEPDIILHLPAFSDPVAAFRTWQSFMNRPKSHLTYHEGQISVHPPQTNVIQSAISSSHVVESLTLAGTLGRLLLGLIVDESTMQAWTGVEPLPEEERCEAVKQLILEMRDLCESHGVTYVTAYLPPTELLPGEDNAIEWQTVRNARLLKNQILAPLAAEHEIPVVYLDEALQNAWKKYGEASLVHEWHVTTIGHKVIHRQLLPFLTDVIALRAQSTDSLPPIETVSSAGFQRTPEYRGSLDSRSSP